LKGLFWREQERNQVGHLLDGDGAFQTFWHQRKAGAGKLRDVARQDRIRQAVGAFERQARRAFFRDDAVDRAAIFCFAVARASRLMGSASRRNDLSRAFAMKRAPH
jgi:hypothetical protein